MEKLTQTQTETMVNAARTWYMRGAPEKTDIINQHLQTGTLPPPELLNFGGKLKPETTIFDTFSDSDIPPRYGKGSGKKPWQDFLIRFTNMDEIVVRKMSRDDCISIAESKGVIPTLTG